LLALVALTTAAWLYALLVLARWLIDAMF